MLSSVIGSFATDGAISRQIAVDLLVFSCRIK